MKLNKQKFEERLNSDEYPIEEELKSPLMKRSSSA